MGLVLEKYPAAEEANTAARLRCYKPARRGSKNRGPVKWHYPDGRGELDRVLPCVEL